MDPGIAAVVGTTITGIVAVGLWWATRRHGESANTRDRDIKKQDKRQQRTRDLLNSVTESIIKLEGAESEFRYRAGGLSPGQDIPPEMIAARRRLVGARIALQRYGKELPESELRSVVLHYVRVDENLERALHDYRGGYEPSGREDEDSRKAYEAALDAASRATSELDAE